MQIGVIFSQADSGTDPEAIRTWVRTAEAAGFDHLLAYDHVLGASAERLGPGPFGSFASAPYTNEHVFHEILVLFAHLAAITERMEFVTSVLVLPPARPRWWPNSWPRWISSRAGVCRSRSASVGMLPSTRVSESASLSRTRRLEEQMVVMRRAVDRIRS